MTITQLSVRFAGAFVLGAILVAALMWLSEAYLGIDSNLGTSLVPVFVAALDAGHTWAKRTKSVPEPALSWQMAVIFTIIVVVISGAQLGLLFAVQPELLADVPLGWMAGGSAFAMLVTFLSCRFFFPFGAKNHLRAESRRK